MDIHAESLSAKYRISTPPFSSKISRHANQERFRLRATLPVKANGRADGIKKCHRPRTNCQTFARADLTPVRPAERLGAGSGDIH
jgi:hypothetical protein